MRIWVNNFTGPLQKVRSSKVSGTPEIVHEEVFKSGKDFQGLGIMARTLKISENHHRMHKISSSLRIFGGFPTRGAI